MSLRLERYSTVGIRVAICLLSKLLNISVTSFRLYNAEDITGVGFNLMGEVDQLPVWGNSASEFHSTGLRNQGNLSNNPKWLALTIDSYM